MKLPYSWLKDYTDVSADIKTYAARMTMTGSKVEGWESPADEISNVVCGKILSIEKHPDSDHLVICQVDIGERTEQIVTGASNLTVGDLVPAALHGAHLPGGIVIKRTKMRGVESNGMLCSMGELGLTEHDCPYATPNGILVLEKDTTAKPGDCILPVLGLDDTTVEFEITPNRPDCLSIIGLARETAASFETPLHIPSPYIDQTQGDIAEHLSVEIQAPDLCPRYSAAMVKDIRIEPAPQWMRDRLRAAGIRPINNIVDITNYVMLEYGQPMHAFDYACIDGKKIIVRRSTEGEKTVTLDGQERQLAKDTLVIADPTKAIGIAGVMGGENSEITENTKMIVFESANFFGPGVRTASRKIGMRTEASGRFEKGLDVENTMPALLRACQLIQQLGAGTVIGGIIDVYPQPKQLRTLKLEPEKISRFIGEPIGAAEMKKTLISFDFKVNGDEVTVPSWRDDVEGMADLAEEVARIHGYDKIRSTLFAGSTTTGGLSPKQRFEKDLASACISMGFSEAKTLSFMSPKVFDRLNLPQDSSKRIATVISNPLGEDQSLMRTTSLPAILDAVARNYNYRMPALRLFELATIYLPQVKDGAADLTVLPEEKQILTMALYGNGDFFTMKGCIQAVLEALSIRNCRFVPCTDNPSYHPGRCAALMSDDTLIGYIGQMHPAVLKNYDIGTAVYVAELETARLLELVDTERLYHPLPKYPAVTRDLAVLCDESIYVLQLEDVIRAAARKALEKVELFDVYRGAQVPEGKKSVAFSLTLRSFDHTLTDTEADEIMTKILSKLEKEYGAVLRA